MKPNNKILKKALTLVGAFLISLTLPTQALAGGAVDGKVISFTTPAKEGTFAYGYGYNNVSWRVDVYVSSRV